jgi:hypothetical protein
MNKNLSVMLRNVKIDYTASTTNIIHIENKIRGRTQNPGALSLIHPYEKYKMIS